MHGPEDCSVGRIQLCAINYLEGDPDAIMEFVTCQMYFNSDPTGETVCDLLPLYENNREMFTPNLSSQCANQLNIPFSALTDCYHSGLGERLQLQAETTTNDLINPLNWVPTIAYDWVSIVPTMIFRLYLFLPPF